MKLNRISLNTIGLNRIGLNRIGSPSRGSSSGSNRPYIDPEVLASLVAVVKCDGKSNNDPDRAIIKNLVDPDNPFVISNAAYTKGSGYADKDSPYYGALVTDGVDNLIVSSKTVQEMLDGSNEITVVSMIHHITGTDVSSFNSVRNFTSVTGRNKLNINNKPINKTGIYGWSRSNLNTVQATTMINNILGDNKDYQTINNDILSFDSIYSIEGYNAENGAQEVSQVAWYWTFIANRVLTTDEINQVIAYYNLDKYVKPDVYYDVKKQGLSNNTPDADWYLKDFSDNGRDMQLYNYGKTPESGINEEGGLQSDGITDYGKAENLPIYKDYTVVADREIVDGLINNADGGVATRGTKWDTGAFCFDYTDGVYSFGATNGYVDRVKPNRFISYMSKYIHNGITTPVGDAVDNNPLCIAKLGSSIDRYSKLALWSFLLFPYSLSEFLLERQLKRHKLGTLYPDMVEFRPIIKSNVSIDKYYFINKTTNKQLNIGDYFAITDTIEIQIYLTDKERQEIASLTVNGKEFTPTFTDTRYLYHIENFGELIGKKSPQKINIAINEYVRYEDIVQPYPTIFRLIDIDSNKEYTYGDKLKVGTKVKIASVKNLLPELYSPVGTGVYNGNTAVSGNIITVEKTMAFGWSRPFTYLKDNEPNCIADPQRLRIPNSSYKILGYIPDISGHGNHLRFNNFAFTEESGVNEDGSIHFDGVEDFITIPTLSHGAKQILMKVNWKNYEVLYDQRTTVNIDTFAIFCRNESYEPENIKGIAYNNANNGDTYIDGIRNENIITGQLEGITHNIVSVNDEVDSSNSKSPVIGCIYSKNANFSQMALFTFMSFPEISSEDEIKELNDIVGIEGGYVESPDYYWDAYGKANRATQDIDYLDLNQAGNAHQVLIDKSKAGLAALELYHNTGNVTELNNRRLVANNFVFNEESGYGGWLGVENLTTALNYRGDTTTNNWERGGTFLKDRNRNDRTGCGYAFAAWFDKANYILKFKVKITGLIDTDELYICQYNTIDPEIKQQLFNGINEVILDLSASIEPTYQYISFRYPPLTNDVDFEFLYEYQNGLVSDGVEDNLKNTNMPVLTDYTWIIKRERLSDKNSVMAYKGDNQLLGAFMFELLENAQYTRSFSASNNSVEFPSLISYQTKNNYNGKTINAGAEVDGSTLYILRSRDTFPYYCKAVFYKAMLYSKTIDMLSINMLKNLFAKDELIDVNNPIFKKDEL